jgi:hypothetical protein
MNGERKYLCAITARGKQVSRRLNERRRLAAAMIATDQPAKGVHRIILLDRPELYTPQGRLGILLATPTFEEVSMEQPLDQGRTTGPQLVLATFTSQQQAGAAIHALRARGVPEPNISVVVRHDTTEVSAQEMAAIDQEADATGTDVAVGGMAGGLAGFVAGIALFSIPGLGPFLGVGVLAGTLGGAALGSAVGERIAHAHFTSLGLSEERAEHYQAALGAGHPVVAVTAPDAEAVMVAREVLGEHGAGEIDVHPAPPDDGASEAAPSTADGIGTTTPGKSTL